MEEVFSEKDVTATLNSAGLNFLSTSDDQFVVTGSNFAKFKGNGNINGVGDYEFQLWDGDGEPDTFSIKIWEEISDIENVVYDNGLN